MALSTTLKEPIGIIKHAKSGTSLAGPSQPKAEKSLYDRLVTKVESAQQSRRIEIIGMVWMQGEADAKKAGHAESYQRNLEALISNARRDFKNPKMAFISGRINPEGNRYKFVDKVRKAQEECMATNYAYIDCDAFEKNKDKVHYTAQGITEMGRSFARALHDVRQGKAAKRTK